MLVISILYDYEPVLLPSAALELQVRGEELITLVKDSLSDSSTSIKLRKLEWTNTIQIRHWFCRKFRIIHEFFNVAAFGWMFCFMQNSTTKHLHMCRCLCVCVCACIHVYTHLYAIYMFHVLSACVYINMYKICTIMCYLYMHMQRMQKC